MGNCRQKVGDSNIRMMGRSAGSQGAAHGREFRPEFQVQLASRILSRHGELIGNLLTRTAYFEVPFSGNGSTSMRLAPSFGARGEPV